MIEQLKAFLNDLKGLRRDIKGERVKQIAKRDLRNRAEQLGSRWFSQLRAPIAENLGVPPEIGDKYADGCSRLIILSSPNNLRKSYLEALDSLIKPFRRELILTAQKGSAASTSLTMLHNVLAGLPDPQENEYLKEAVSCAQRRFLRAAVVLGWCATIDRIHRRIEQVGFAQFNVGSVQMASHQKGRFKRFSSPQNVNSLSELRGVLDTVVLWVIEGMGMVDANQHTRLKSCFDMRCQCAHPGEAPVTEYNLMSFFSDINEIVFQNTVFRV